MTDQAVITGTYADLKLIKTRKTAQMIIELPIEHVPQLIERFGMPDYGAEIPVAVARLNGPVAQTTEQHRGADDGKNPSGSTKPKSYAQRAGILSNSEAFWRFAIDHTPNPPETYGVDNAAQFIRDECGVKSRRDLIEGTPAGNKFRDLEIAFKAWKLVA